MRKYLFCSLIALILGLFVFTSCKKLPNGPEPPEPPKRVRIQYDYYRLNHPWDSEPPWVSFYASWLNGSKNMEFIKEDHWRVVFESVPVNYGEDKSWDEAFKVGVGDPLNQTEFAYVAEDLFANGTKLTLHVNFILGGTLLGKVAVHRVDSEGNIYNID